MIAIIDYGMGNVGSIKNILSHVGAKDIQISSERDILKKADKLILPGVGAFDKGVENLKSSGLFDIIKEAVVCDKKPILGICLGMQLLGRSSEEGKKKGLELIAFENVKFISTESLKVPHMGWDYVDIKRTEPIVKGLDSLQRYYFVHSYYAKCDSQDNILMTSNYGHEFAAAVVMDNIIGVQFHPEKSHQFGMKIMENFVKEY